MPNDATKPTCTMAEAYEAVLGGVMAISPELYSQALRAMAKMMGRTNDDVFQNEVMEHSRSLPCDLD